MLHLGSPHGSLRVPLPPRANGRHQAGGAAHPGEDHDGSDSVTQSWSCIDNFLLKLFTTLNHKVSFSYLLEGQTPNVVQIEGPFPPSIDPTRYVAKFYRPNQVWHKDSSSLVTLNPIFLFQVLLTPLSTLWRCLLPEQMIFVCRRARNNFGGRGGEVHF